jgi:FlaA1/EpsC-like NDP-sugar epimerase
MIIKRPLLHPIVISKDSILKTEVIKNINHTMRLIFLPMGILLQVILIMDAVNTISRYIAQNDPLAVIISFVFLRVTTMVLFVVLFYKAYIRSYYPDALKVTARNNKEVTLYIDNPQDMERKLGGVK